MVAPQGRRAASQLCSDGSAIGRWVRCIVMSRAVIIQIT